MKVLTRAEFLALKGPVLYSKWEANWAHPESVIRVKNNNCNDDDWYQIVLNGIDVLEEQGTGKYRNWAEYDTEDWKQPIEVDLIIQERDGLYEHDCRFVIFEANDIGEFMRNLTECFQHAVAMEKENA